MGTLSPARAAHIRRSSCQQDERGMAEEDVVQGRILWLPPKDELPQRAVRRAHGKGAIEEGIFNHPVVVISRPTEEPDVAHFHIITSFGGKKLHEIYGKANEFHQGRRSWYLPISPSPPHPDATSKKAKKRFPTLDIADGASLRWDSYVNLRDVYKIEWSCLRHYGNPDTPFTHDYRLQRESMIRLLAKGRQLTGYFPDNSQVQPKEKSLTSAPLSASPTVPNTQLDRSGAPPAEFPKWDSSSDTSPVHSTFSQASAHPFLGPQQSHYGTIHSGSEEPPGGDRNNGKPGFIRYIVQHFLRWTIGVIKYLWARFRRRGGSGR